MRLVEVFVDSGDVVLWEQELEHTVLGVTNGEDEVTFEISTDGGHRRFEMTFRRDELAALTLRLPKAERKQRERRWRESEPEPYDIA